MKIFAFVLLLLIAPSAVAQTPPEQTPEAAVFESFQKSISTLKAKSGTKDAKITESIKKIDDDVKFLQILETSGKKNPKEYVENLALDADLLKKLAEQKYNPKSKSDRKRLYEGLQDVGADLEVKVDHLKSGRGDVARLIEVSIRAKKEDQDAGGYEVWYVPKGLAKNSNYYKRFDNLTNPSNPPSMNLAPGNYVIWLNKGQAKTDPQPVSVGGDGRSKREIDLVIP